MTDLEGDVVLFRDLLRYAKLADVAYATDEERDIKEVDPVFPVGSFEKGIATKMWSMNQWSWSSLRFFFEHVQGEFGNKKHMSLLFFCSRSCSPTTKNTCEILHHLRHEKSSTFFGTPFGRRPYGSSWRRYAGVSWLVVATHDLKDQPTFWRSKGRRREAMAGMGCWNVTNRWWDGFWLDFCMILLFDFNDHASFKCIYTFNICLI